MKEIIHQVYGVFNDNKPLEDIPIFKTQVLKTIEFCEKYKIEYKMWNNDDCEKLINKYPQYRQLYDNFRFPFLW